MSVVCPRIVVILCSMMLWYYLLGQRAAIMGVVAGVGAERCTLAASLRSAAMKRKMWGDFITSFFRSGGKRVRGEAKT